MAGHSKWSNIKHRKGAQDKKRAKFFMKAIKEITIAIKENNKNGDPDTNPALRSAIQNARGVNMPKDNIDRAIKKASGADADDYQMVSYEGYGPHGIAVFVDCMTDNPTRTVAIVRAIFSKNGGSLGTNGSLSFLFESQAVFTIPKDQINIDLEELELELIEFGVETIEEEEEVIVIYAPYNEFGKISEQLEKMGIQPSNAGIKRIPHSTTALEVEQAKDIIKLIDAFEDEDDIQEVYHNLELTDELIEHLNNE